ncbi:efflux transporter outer membrane subunit [Variovorax sp. PBL-E5]|uniref:efflux transporter outer membrane subunit n=1 Tax=Variovorax sp. PBL-E5 TaxID=434014 RepID=UPI0013180454|nr:efflux transporter outer membrane subunit [Variovorax sp. PBL-E5]VTU37257.1 Outer membrane protein OprM precursor [Variovorax sp. PBL-E5]
MNRPGFTIVLGSLACVAALSGCAAGPDFQRPDPPPAQRYTAEHLQVETASAGDDATQHVRFGERPAADWWRLFGSDALDAVVQRALAGNRTLAAAASTLAQAQELAAAQAGTLAPQLSLGASAGRQKYGAELLGKQGSEAPFTYFAVGPSVSYTLDYTGGGARSVEQSRALAAYQRRQLDAAHLAVAGNAVMQALRIASLRAQVATVDAILAQDRENLKLVQTAFDAGSVSRLDIVSAQSQLASDTTLLPPLRQQLGVARHALAVVLGQAPAEAALTEPELARLTLPRSLPVSLPSELARRRPDILAAEAQLHAATAAVGVADANLYPHITLSASAGQQAVELSHLFDRAGSVWSLAGGLVAPLFDGGTLRAEQRAAVDALHASTANYEQTVLVAFGQVADALQALDDGAGLLQAQAHAQTAAAENLDLTRKSYHEGYVGVLQVLDAERLYQQARLGYVRAEAQRYLDTAQLFLALGGAGPDSGPQVSPGE